MTFVDFAQRTAPRVLSEDAGQALLGASALRFDLTADALRSALRAPLIADTEVGPAFDALTLLGQEAELPQYPGETWYAYRARLASLWDDAQLFGTNTGMLAQFAAAGFVGIQIKTPPDWPTVEPTGYWSQFWILFPLGTHSVVSSETQVVTTETGEFVEYDAEGLTLEQYRTIRSIVARHKPGHWICRNVFFEWNPSLLNGLTSEFWTGADVEDEITFGTGTAIASLGVFAQATPALRPTWVDPYVDGDGTQYLETADAGLLAALNAAPNLTIAFRSKRDDSGAAQTILSTDDDFAIRYTAGNALEVDRDGAAVSVADNGSPHVWVLTLDGSTCTVYLDGALATSGTIGTSALSGTAAQLFAEAGADILDGRIYGLGVWSGVASPTQVTQLSAWFADNGADVAQFPGFPITPYTP